MGAPGDDSYEVLIVGAGPVGMLLGNLLGARGVRCLVVDKRPQAPETSRAVGIMPPSLEIFARLGLDRVFIERGLKVTTARVHGDRGPLGSVHFDRLPGPYPFLLTLPQAETVGILEEQLRLRSSVTLRRGLELTGLSQREDRVNATFRDVTGQTEERWEGSFLVGCDGRGSRVRELAGLVSRQRTYRPTFLMADFEDRSDLGQEAHVYLTAKGSAESFPLPGRRRRWVVLTDRFVADPPDELLADTVRERTGIDLRGSGRSFLSPFRVEHLLCRRSFTGRVVLAGDAAHVMSPIGGQGMNTGLADAELLADALFSSCLTGEEPAPMLRRYEFLRRRAFQVAAARAARGMWLGTRTGPWVSSLRALLVRSLLLGGPLSRRLPPYFAMLTVPPNTLTQGEG